MITLCPVHLQWVQGTADEPKDLCPHAHVDFRIGDDVLVGDRSGLLTVSAAALYLLRTLSVPHTRESRVGEQLFPCCGFYMVDFPESDDVVILGCPNGEDLEILHNASGDGVIIRTYQGSEWQVGWPQWRNGVFSFADEVSGFYAACSPKQPYDAEAAAGFRKFAAEWARRRGRPLAVKILDPSG